ncbi:SprB repeat-containing protein [Hymenobacter rubidus]|uniref:SprB repeat-containing protein n=1 Tax=Hymenobacter rubidus TaxID=1441626 RepID=UPI00191D6B63|nr:SprB repeat-containing protein [Hymenobacter rubidus]
MYLLKSTWVFFSAVIDTDNNYLDPIYKGDVYEFDETTRTVVHSPDVQQQAPVPGPPDYSRDPTQEFYVWVDGATRTGYFHDGNGGVTTVITTLVLTATVTAAVCYGGNTGAIALVTAGMAGPFTFSWSDGVTTQNRGPVRAGTYRVVVTDGPSGAIARATVQVGTNPELAVTVQSIGPNITLQVTGGSGLYTYLWSDGATTRDRTGLAAGPYSVTITDALGCSTEVAVQVNTDLFFWSRNPITLALDAGNAYRLDHTLKPNLTFLCEVWVEKVYLSGDFTLVGGVLEQPADRDGRTEFQVQALLDTFLQHHVPPVGATGVLRADPLFRRFYLKHAESFGDTPVRAATTVLVQNYVVLGGLNFYESRSRTFFTTYQPAVKPFLTWEPPVKSVLADQPEFLYYLVSESPAGFRFQLRVQYTDGTNEVLNLGGVDTVRLHEVYCRPVGYQALGLASLAGPKQVLWWETWVTTPDEATVLSETRRFVLDTRVFPHRRYLLFATSLGGMATYAALGEALTEGEVTGDEGARTLTPYSDPLLGDTAVQTRQLRPVVKLASGPRTRAQMQAAQDLLLSRRVLLLDQGRWVPGFIKAKTSPLRDESKNVPTLDFDFYLTTEELYTPRLGSDQVTYALGS